MSAPSDLLPYYLRDPDGVDTGLQYRTREDAEEAAAARPGYTVDGPDLYVTGDRGWAGQHVQLVSPAPVEPRWKPRGWGGTE